MYIAPYNIEVQRYADVTLKFSAYKTGAAVLGLLPAGVSASLMKPGAVAVTVLPVNAGNFRENGLGVYEYDLSGANTDVDGLYGLEFSGASFDAYTGLLVVGYGRSYLMQKAFGFGTVVLSETYGGTVPVPKPLQIISGGLPLGNVRFFVFLESDYNAGNTDVATYAKGIGESDLNGDWKWPILVEPGDYVIVADVGSNYLSQLLNVVTFTAAAPVVTPQPTVISATPATGPAAGGTLVTLVGTQFVDGCTIKFGATASASVSFISATMVKAIAPAHAAGAVGVTVMNPDFQFGVLSAGYLYV